MFIRTSSQKHHNKTIEYEQGMGKITFLLPLALDSNRFIWRVSFIAPGPTHQFTIRRPVSLPLVWRRRRR